ncbi:MAG TPA: xanthine dehydrogenase family protein molybdopterin-binding subunit [Solirubrobacteraceae bacterium]|nr:xanthine dehydrogenase family protein molybdopterin-binding subunit [Solirubrobacteraceae bacterium]
MATGIGQRIRRREDPRFLLGHGRYVDDQRVQDALHVTFVRSYVAHGRITSIDADEARALPGVQVFTAAEIGLPPSPPPPMLQVHESMNRPAIASDKVRFAGEIVAIVLAESREASVDAAEMVFVEYESLPAVIDIRKAEADEVLLFEPAGSNTCLRIPPQEPDEALLADCEIVVSGTNESPRLLALPIEPRATVAEFSDGKLTIWLSTQTPHQDKSVLVGALGLEEEQVRVIAPDVGGGFGGKGLDVEDILMGWVARETGRPVRWTETRSEHMVSMHHGRAQEIDFKLGGSREGKLQALRIKILQDSGAYPGIGAFLAVLTQMMASGVYDIPKIEVDITAVVTNSTPTGPVRGAGRPEASQMIERAIDIFAAEAGLDPAEVRRRNFIAADAFPFTTAVGTTYDVGDYAGALERALEQAGYDELRREQAQLRADGSRTLLGIGISVYVEITNGISEGEFGAVEITDDGGAIVRTGSFSHGQGHETTFAQIVAQRTGIDVERIQVVAGDTDRVPRGTGTYGSKSTQIGGAAAGQASEMVVDRAKQLAAEQLEANPEDMVLNLDGGRFHVTGAPEPALDWADLAGRLEADGQLAELSIETDFKPEQPTFPFGAHVAVVEVDADTGSVRLLRMIACDDAGTIINPMIAEGQVHGGLAAGIAQALYEEVRYDSEGNPQHSNLVTYCIPSAAELPSFERVVMETPTPVNPLGAKGIGESGTIGATPAVHNAVCDALAHLGVRHVGMPANGENIWRAIVEAGG